MSNKVEWAMNIAENCSPSNDEAILAMETLAAEVRRLRQFNEKLLREDNVKFSAFLACMQSAMDMGDTTSISNDGWDALVKSFDIARPEIKKAVQYFVNGIASL